MEQEANEQAKEGGFQMEQEASEQAKEWGFQMEQEAIEQAQEGGFFNDRVKLRSRIYLTRNAMSKRMKLTRAEYDRPETAGLLPDSTTEVGQTGARSTILGIVSKRQPQLSSHGITPELLPWSYSKTHGKLLQDEEILDTLEHHSSIQSQAIPSLEKSLDENLKQDPLVSVFDEIPAGKSDAKVKPFPRISCATARSSGMIHRSAAVGCTSNLGKHKIFSNMEADGREQKGLYQKSYREDTRAFDSKARSKVMTLISWKSKRGRFAEATAGSTAQDYPWMLFLQLLKERPDYPEFVYLQPRKVAQSSFDPYDLEIVTYGEICSPYYYTMSSAGVTLWGGVDAEFIPLDEWEINFEYYKCIMKLRVFRQYKIWKNFSIWRHFVRRKLQGHCRKALQKQLFLMNPILQRVILQIRHMSLGISMLRFFHFENNFLYTLENFYEVQQTKCKEIMQKIFELSDEVVSNMKHSCSEVLAMIENELLGQRNGDTEIFSNSGSSLLQTCAEVAGTSKLVTVAVKWRMEKEKAAKEKENQERFSFAIAAAKRKERHRLLKFVRFADYVITQSLRQILMGSFVELLQKLIHHTMEGIQFPPGDLEMLRACVKRDFPDGRYTDSQEKNEVKTKFRQSIFEVKLIIEEDQLRLCPNFTEFEGKLKQLLKSIPDELRLVWKLDSHPELDGLFERMAIENEGVVSYMDLIDEEPLAAVMSLIMTSIFLSFQDAEVIKVQYQPFLNMLLLNQSISIEGMHKEVDESQRDVGKFRLDLDTFLEQEARIKALPSGHDVGIFHINNSYLKESLLPSPRYCLQIIFTLLPQILTQRYQVFIAEIHTATKKLLTKPSSAEEFVEVVSFLQCMHEKIDSLEEQYLGIKEYISLMQDYQIPIPEIDFASYQMMGADFNACKDAMVTAEEGKVENAKLFSADLIKQMEQVKNDVTLIHQAANHDMILDENSDMQEVLAYVRNLSDDIIARNAQYQCIQQYQRLFQIEETQYDELQAVANEVEMKKSLWSALEDLGLKGVIWANTHFEKLQLEEIEEVVQRYIAGIRSDVEKVENQLKHFGHVLDEWLECQKQWMYLESIFSAPDIQRQLPNESKAFNAVDKQFKDIMKRVHDRPNALQAGLTVGWLETFQKSNETLEKIQKNLEDYLETKRMAFPRFYFLSNDELLEILAQTRNVQAVQPHLSKCFDGIRRLDFGDDPRSIDIFAMVSSEGERVSLGKNLKARGNVESWLTAVEQNMNSSLRRMAKAAHMDYVKKPRKDWVLKHPAQLVVMISQVYWCHSVETSLLADNKETVEINLLAYKFQCVNQLEDLSVLVRGNLHALERRILTTLITIDVHARDIVEDLVRDKVHKATEFGWQMQLRYYWEDSVDDCIIRQINARFLYGYEYLGAQSRLVITPLTDRCYMTLSGALHLKLGGAPAGPAGTGKTETTKDLAKALGVQCVVFNCGDNLDYKFMGKFFAGLAQCGAWACFDEFNRIDIEVLSVVAQQLLTIQNALKAGITRFNFEGREIKLLPTCGVFITMNPGYAGRTELPDNLKVLFRPVSMMIPDYALVAEVMLFSEGFANAKILSRKMVKLYKLASEQLSQQDHYDFGMRAVKSVLVMAGSLRRANPELNEDAVLIRAFKDSNLPKFLAQDVSLFLAIIADLFPGVTIPPQDFGVLKAAVEECIIEAGLQPVPMFVLKTIQLFETMNVRFGVMEVGPTGGGKTTCYQMLQAAMTKLRQAGNPNPSFQITHSYVLNPKCIRMGELYGEYNLLTNEWTDGLGSAIIRQCVVDTTLDRKWVIFDGPVDAIWIENMNTVLDDNCILCLPNGERIKLNSVTMRMMFEVQDLAVASPATVSRCGMVYVPPENLGWRPFVKSWLQKLPTNVSIVNGILTSVTEYIWNLFDTYVDYGLNFLRQTCKENIPSVNINIVTSLCFYFQALCQPTREVNLQHDLDVLAPILNKVFSFSYVWSVGGNVDHHSIEKFDKFCKKELESVVTFPTNGTVYDYFYSPKEQAFSPWEEIVPNFTYHPSAPFFTLMVPTQDSTRLSFLMEISLEVQRSVLFQGVSGVGKSAIVLDLLSRLRETKDIVPVVLNFSAQTTSIATQEAIEGKLEKKRKTKLGAPFGKKIACFVDDVNMPAKERFHAQPPIELLRQFQDFRGFYDRQQLFWKDIEDMTLLAACAPPGGGRNEVTPRFFRHFSMLCVQPPSEQCLCTIFGGILGGFLQLFSAECKTFLKPVVDCTIEVYMRISQELLPTPAKSHYTFNVRDVSKVFQGILMIKPVDCGTKKVLRSLWIHESMRVFHDRLINEEDREYFKRMLYDLIKRSFEESSTYEEALGKPPMFGAYLRPGYSAEDRHYEQVVDESKQSEIFKEYLEDYNMSTTNIMKLVFFKDAIEHISHICRILRQPRGNAMLVGVGGSGKQSLTRFACFLEEHKCFQIELKKGYNVADYREDLKKLYKIAGIEGNPVTFLLTDTQIIDEGFVEDINNLLNSGEIPGLFTSDEKDRIAGEMRNYVNKLGLPETKEVLYTSFINRVRDNLHVVLCMSPIGDAFRARCRKFPSLINCCTIDWFNEWPEQALLSVGNYLLATVDLPTQEIKASLANLCVYIHTSVSETADMFYQELHRKYYITPKSFLDCVNLYIQLLAEKRQELFTAQDRFLNGLNKLQETNVLIESMKVDLGKLQPILAEKTEKTKKLIKQVANDQDAAQKVKDVVGQEEAEVKKQAAETQLMRDDAQKDLDTAMPALTAAVESLNLLNKNDITEIKSFAKPPPLVQLVLEAVCVLLGEKPDWDTAKKTMGDMGFIKRLVEYNKDGISLTIQKKLAKYIDDSSFQPELVQKQSNAATSLCMWVRAMDVYAKVSKVVAPKKEALKQAEEALKNAADKLAAKQQQLTQVEAQVELLKKSLQETEAEQARLQEQALVTENRLVRAGKLTAALGDELVRWKETADEIGTRREMLVGDVFVCAACIAYYGAFSGPYRRTLVSRWVRKCKEKGIPVSDSCSLRGILSTAVEVREWSIWGLPTDDVSVDNGILVTRGKRWPLMIDPQGQANNWIKAMEAKNGLRVVRLTDANLLRTLESSIRIGNPVLLEDIADTLDPALEPILQKQIFEKNGRHLIRLGDTDVDYDQNFRLYMTTKMPNPHYIPDICIKVTLVNFTVTMKGLEDQLLGDVVRKERSDLEEQNDRLVVSISSDKKQLKDLEDKILKLLKESQGNILDDEVLINTLNNSKLTSGVIQGRVKQAETTEKEITSAREQYRVVATRGSILYFVISDLALVDSMYQYSLGFFCHLFNYCIESSEKSEELETRLSTLISFVTEFMYLNVSRGLFEQHKVTFSFLICTSIMRAAGEIQEFEWNFFLRGAPLSMASQIKLLNPAPQWISETVWQNCCALEEVSKQTFSGLSKDIVDHLGEWKSFIEAAEPQIMPLPTKWETSIEPFQRLVLLKSLREEKVVYACESFIREKLGHQFVGSVPLQLEEVFKDTSNLTPIIFILSTGADPTVMLQRFGEKVDRKPGERLHIISLGQGQGPIAEMLVSKSRKTGDWVCLQNCHLASSWMQTMERIIENFAPEAADIHPDFRLWLTSIPCKEFPVPVLQNGIKITNEPPKGVRANLLQSYANFSDNFLESCARKGPWKKLVFAISFLHAVIQERRKFGPLGWNIKYDFNNSDLDCALQTLRMFLEEQSEIPWPALLYVTGEITYGGRVTDDLDRRCLMSTLRCYYNPSVLSDSYSFTSSKIYISPPEGVYSSYVNYIKSLPSTESPDVFGMHENANLTFQLQESNKILANIASIQPRATNVGGGKSSDQTVSDMAEKILAELPALLHDSDGHSTSTLGPDGQISPLAVVLMQGFLTGALQLHARKYQIPIDTLNFGFKVTGIENEEDVFSAPADGIYISGLFLDGARWDHNNQWLAEAFPGEMHFRLPIVHFIPIVNYKPPPSEYQCPLYKTHVRAGVLTTTGASTNFVLNISLRINPQTCPDFWVLQGVSLICQLGN